MNIFYLDNNPKACAQMHVDKHCVKMILEYAQLLSTAHRILDGVPHVGVTATGRKKKSYRIDSHLDSLLYSATHANHPSAIWVRKSIQNYIWLCELLEELCAEYTHRYGKIHKVESSGLMIALKNNFPKNMPIGDFFTEPTPAMPDIYKVDGDSIQSYKNYYLGDKQRMFSWKNRQEPKWITINANV